MAQLARAKSERTNRQHFTVQSTLLMASFVPASGLCGRLMLPMCAHCEPVQQADANTVSRTHTGVHVEKLQCRKFA